MRLTGAARRRALTFAIAATMLAVMLAATQEHGIGISTDSVSYARAADRLVERGALEVPLTAWRERAAYVPLVHFPPLVPLLLAVMPGDGFAAARWLNAACIVATSLVVLGAAHHDVLGPLAALALLAGPSFLAVHLWAWSEPLFLVFTAVAVALADRVGPAPGAARRAATLGVVCGLATLTRLAGGALFLGCGAIVLWCTPSARRARSMLAYGAAYGALVGPWLAWLRSAGGGQRWLGFYPAGLGHEIQHLGRTMLDWVLPRFVPLPLRLVAAAAVVVAVVAALRTGDARGRRVARALVLVAAYLGFVVVARLVMDPAIELDDRMLSPALVLAAAALPAVVATVCPRPVPRVLAGAVLAAVAAANAAAAVPYLRQAARHGNGFATPAWRRSEAVAWLDRLPPGVTIFSNAADAIAALRPVPVKHTPAEWEVGQLAAFAQRVDEARPSVLVLFGDLHPRWLVPRRDIVAAVAPGGTHALADATVLTWGLPAD